MSLRLIVRSPRSLTRKQRCVRCKIRWRQHATGRCRQCEKTVAGLVLTTFQVEEARIRRLAELTARLIHEQAVSEDRRTVTIDGRDYIIMWDGSLDGAAARGLPMAADRGSKREWD